MKFIHTADLHLSSPMESRFTPEQAKTRKRELFDVFERMSDYAVTEKVTAILLCGDIFDSKTPPQKDIRRFFELISDHPTIDYLYITGNHEEALLHSSTFPSNFKTFSDEWGCLHYQNVNIYGVNINKKNCAEIYQTLTLQLEKKNIVMLHGQIRESKGTPSADEIILPMLADKAIDYLALGHIHAFKHGKIDRRGCYCYSGCPEGRGYDECGEKGFVLLTVEDSISFEFVSFAKRTVHEVQVDITDLESDRAILDQICTETASIPESDMARILLIGTLSSNFQPQTELLEEKLSTRFFHLLVKDHTCTVIDPLSFPPMSLEATFYRTVFENEALSEEDKAQIFRIGLSALRKEKVQLK